MKRDSSANPHHLLSYPRFIMKILLIYVMKLCQLCGIYSLLEWLEGVKEERKEWGWRWLLSFMRIKSNAKSQFLYRYRECIKDVQVDIIIIFDDDVILISNKRVILSA